MPEEFELRNNPLAVLRRAREILWVRDRWTKGALARDRDRAPVPASAPDATCWCAAGMVARLAPSGTIARYEAFRALSVVARRELAARGHERALTDTDENIIGVFNDDEETMHPQLMRLFDEAIENLETRTNLRRGEDA